MRASTLLLRLVNWVLWFIGIVIGLRVVLKFFGANPTAPFVDWVYETSEPLLAPFMGMFPAPAIEGRYVIEFSALFALIVYGLAASLIEEMIARIEGWSLARNKGKR
jgi:uncharacterized protein YggT (Ycf19 family)